MKITQCKKCGLKYPKNWTECPRCTGRPTPPKRPQKKLEEYLADLPDIKVQYIFQSTYWEQGTSETRRKCVAEFNKRFGAENWPAHIAKE